VGQGASEAQREIADEGLVQWPTLGPSGSGLLMKVTYAARRVIALLSCGIVASCAGAVMPRTQPAAVRKMDALLILPGFGYSRGGERVLRSLEPTMAAAGFDLFVPTYIARGGLVDSRAKLQRLMQEHHLERYERLHVFAFIAGAWTFNPIMERSAIPNVATVVYDRSPFQERAPRIADEALHFRTWLRYGSPVFDVAKTPYLPLTTPNVAVGIVVETAPTALVKSHEALARSYGPLAFDCQDFQQRYDDCIYLPFSHDQVYTQFATVWPELLAFIKNTRFTSSANRTPPSGDPWASR
jgi:hypothetical protein